MKKKLERGKTEISKAVVNDVMEVHNLFWESYARRDIELRFSLCSEDVTFIGSGLNERAINKSEYKEINETGVKQFPDAFKIKFLWTHFTLVNENVACVESEAVWSQLINKKESKELLRNTTLLKCEKNIWLVTHVHGSVPDYRLKDGDYMTNEQTIIRNQELERQVFERTQDLNKTLEELEQKNRELEIESALEKVRTIAMGMRKPDDMLDVCKTISLQLQALGVKEIRNVQTAIFYEQRGTYMNYEYYAKHDKTVVTETTYTNNKLHEEFALKMIKGKGEVFITHIKGDEVKDWIAYQKTTNVFIDKYLETASSLNYYWFSLGPVALGISTYHPLTEEEINLFKRFLKVFELAYQRYLDIEKAEAQARESQIELALERVRARTMAMQKSEELKEVIRVVYEQFVHLKINVDHAGFVVDYTPKGDWHFWIADEQDIPSKITHPYFESIWAHQFNEAKDKGEDFFATNLNFEEKNKFYNELLSYVPSLPDTSRDFYLSCPGLAVTTALFDNVSLYIENFSGTPYTHEENKILIRFGKVFQQTYTRFLDLQKAEAQAREAQIEVALERIRARAMAMHTSDELMDVAGILREQMGLLGQPDLETSVINLFEENSDQVLSWHVFRSPELLSGKIITGAASFPWDSSAISREMMEAYRSGHQEFTMEADGVKAMELFQVLVHAAPEIAKYAGDSLPERVCYHLTFFSGGALLMVSYQLPSEEAKSLQRRAASVFDLAYRRYRDLKKAEAQAREAQIEASLEKVRSSAMAMHKSNDISSTTTAVFEELRKLNIQSKRCGVALLSKNSHIGHVYAAATSSDGKFLTLRRSIDMTQHQSLQQQYESWKKQENYFIEMNRDELKSYYQLPFFYSSPDYVPPANYERSEYGYYIPFSEGLFYVWTEEPYSESEINILNRFKSIIDLTFRRYFDLQKAEAQVREAQIEASLERVRSKAMAMHSPNDLSETVNVFFKELKTLGIIPIRCGVGQIDEATRTTSLTTTTSSQQGDSFQVIGKIKQTGHPVLDGIFDNWKLQKEYHPVLEGEDVKAYYDVMNPQIGYPDYPEGVTQYGNCFYFKEGFVFAWTESKLSEEELQIFRRFTSVLSLTYRRYLDLKEAEARAFEAVREASLDRVRAEIASMRTAEDLNHITPIIWRELKTLEVPFIRCGVFIVDENHSKVQVYLSTPDGKSLGVLNLPFNTNELTTATVEHWRKKIVYTEHWNKDQFINWAHSMIEIGQIQNAETYQGSANPPESLNLHFVPFEQGMLYVGNISSLNEEKLQLVKTLAKAFSIAYARYEDFKNLEEAKNKIEVTLKELKSAQVQLIHSEKMASLGELTAGIAHEIKNPLNFINNFSELSNELLDEMKIELQNDNTEEAMAIVNDVKQNLEKIYHHGKRADSIVKGMLQHSRGSSGEKTLTDINDLLDQYVNLAYHGLRAQNKEFNIIIEKNYDAMMEKINVVPQDISRVFLNIINNACYAAYDKKLKSEDNNFSPTLKVSTKNLDDSVEIKIADNGNGIPKDILDKIFQPFFTTKPTGEGTGLGLSLSYDIVVKQHAGEIKFESVEGKYTEFIINLPKQ